MIPTGRYEPEPASSGRGSPIEGAHRCDGGQPCAIVAGAKMSYRMQPNGPESCGLGRYK